MRYNENMSKKCKIFHKGNFWRSLTEWLRTIVSCPCFENILCTSWNNRIRVPKFLTVPVALILQNFHSHNFCLISESINGHGINFNQYGEHNVGLVGLSKVSTQLLQVVKKLLWKFLVQFRDTWQVVGKVLLVGDPMQLPPTMFSQETLRKNYSSMMERFKSSPNVILLDIQYRYSLNQ